MEKIILNEVRKPRLKNPVLVGGLPGIGNVGRIAAEYLVEKLKMKKMWDLFSQFFPPQVLIKENGEINLVRNSVYYKKFRDKPDLLVLLGDSQSTTQEGQYELSHYILTMLKNVNVSMIYTLGGYSTGRIVEDPRVLGAVTRKDLVPSLKKSGVVFPKGEPGGGIVGSAGLLLGLAKEMFSIDGVCLMGETSGYFADPKGAIKILVVLKEILDLDLDLKELQIKSKQIEEITGRIQEENQPYSPSGEDLGYFG